MQWLDPPSTVNAVRSHARSLRSTARLNMARSRVRSASWSRMRPPTATTTRHYFRLVSRWVASIGLNPWSYGTHSLLRTRAALIYRRTGNLRAVQLFLGHSKIENTVRYLGIEVEDALTISEELDV